jgi:hypothetical protein
LLLGPGFSRPLFYFHFVAIKILSERGMIMSNDNLTIAMGGVNQLIDEVKKQLNEVDDMGKQMKDLSILINNFILQTLSVVSDNEDLSEVNQVLVNSLIQVKDFANNRPAEIQSAKVNLENRLGAYEQCMLVMQEANKLGESAVDEPDEDEAALLEREEAKKKE